MKDQHKLLASKIILVLIILVCFGTVIGVIGYSVSVKRNLSVNSNDISDWKTYRNDKFGYEVRYPNDWLLYTDNPSEVFIQPDNSSAPEAPGAHATALVIGAAPIKVGDTLEQIEQRNSALLGTGFDRRTGIKITRKPVMIGGIQGIKENITCDSGCNSSLSDFDVVYGNNFYYLGQSSDKYIRIYNQIITTFRFTEK